MTPITIMFLIVLVVVWKTFVVVPQRQACVQERLGKFSGVLEPGFHFLIPFIDRIAYRQEMREQVLDVPAQMCITKDNIQVEVDGLVYLRVMDAERASYGIHNYRVASINLCQTTMRSEVGKLDLEEIFSERETLNSNIVTEVDKASDPWGIKVLRYEIKNITPSANVVHTLEKQMEAERSKRAEVTLALAGKEATIVVSEGQRQADINMSEGSKQRRINLARGRAAEIALVSEATAYSIRRVAEAIGKPGGSEAVKMQIVEQFVDQLGGILADASVSVVPNDLANIQGVFEGISRTGEAMNGRRR
jgi:regulator of protease activity HflC (stomatin/prohibitin superfamily)